MYVYSKWTRLVLARSVTVIGPPELAVDTATVLARDHSLVLAPPELANIALIMRVSVAGCCEVLVLQVAHTLFALAVGSLGCHPVAQCALEQTGRRAVFAPIALPVH